MTLPPGPARVNLGVSPAVHRRLTVIRDGMAAQLERDVKYNEVLENLLDEHDATHATPAEEPR